MLILMFGTFCFFLEWVECVGMISALWILEFLNFGVIWNCLELVGMSCMFFVFLGMIWIFVDWCVFSCFFVLCFLFSFWMICCFFLILLFEWFRRFGTFGLVFLLNVLECFGKLFESFDMMLDVFECVGSFLNVLGCVLEVFLIFKNVRMLR